MAGVSVEITGASVSQAEQRITDPHAPYCTSLCGRFRKAPQREPLQITLSWILPVQDNVCRSIGIVSATIPVYSSRLLPKLRTQPARISVAGMQNRFRAVHLIGGRRRIVCTGSMVDTVARGQGECAQKDCQKLAHTRSTFFSHSAPYPDRYAIAQFHNVRRTVKIASNVVASSGQHSSRIAPDTR